jgi:hypothetical protein
MGGRWEGSQLQRMALRLGLTHPPAVLRAGEARARIQALWKQQPEITAKEVIARLGVRHLLGIARARKLLKDCRAAAAKRSSVQRKLGWRLDNWTAARIRISAIWKRHPELTASHVLEMLGPQQPLRLNWVRYVLGDCRQGVARCRHPERPVVASKPCSHGRGWLPADTKS